MGGNRVSGEQEKRGQGGRGAGGKGAGRIGWGRRRRGSRKGGMGRWGAVGLLPLQLLPSPKSSHPPPDLSPNTTVVSLASPLCPAPLDHCRDALISLRVTEMPVRIFSLPACSWDPCRLCCPCASRYSPFQALQLKGS